MIARLINIMVVQFSFLTALYLLPLNRLIIELRAITLLHTHAWIRIKNSCRGLSDINITINKQCILGKRHCTRLIMIE